MHPGACFKRPSTPARLGLGEGRGQWKRKGGEEDSGGAPGRAHTFPPSNAHSHSHAHKISTHTHLPLPLAPLPLGWLMVRSQAGGTCSLLSDGFYIVGWVCLILGTTLGLVYLRLLPALMQMPLSRWRVAKASGSSL